MQNLTVLGGGVLGAQIALQSAFQGKKVTIWLRTPASVDRCEKKLKSIVASYEKEIDLMARHQLSAEDWCFGICDFDPDLSQETATNLKKTLKNARKTLILEQNLEKSVQNADLIIEATTEDLKQKKDLLTRVSPFLSKNAILATNSSTILPSKMLPVVKNPENFLAIHFANSIWKNNTAEIMRTKKTSDETFARAIDFAREIRMIPLPLQKEKSGYLLNSMLVPFLFSALDLLVTGVSDVETIDRAWKHGVGVKEGPFEILDVVGIKTASAIVKMYTKIPSVFAPYHFRAIDKYLEQMIEDGKIGKISGEGFYKY